MYFDNPTYWMCKWDIHYSQCFSMLQWYISLHVSYWQAKMVNITFWFFQKYLLQYSSISMYHLSKYCPSKISWTFTSEYILLYTKNVPKQYTLNPSLLFYLLSTFSFHVLLSELCLLRFTHWITSWYTEIFTHIFFFIANCILLYSNKFECSVT